MATDTRDSQSAITARRHLSQQILSRVGSLPGVEAAGMTDYLPLGQNRAWGTPFPKGVKRPDQAGPGPLVYVISPGYMRAMGTRVRGRDFTWSDGPTEPAGGDDQRVVCEVSQLIWHVAGWRCGWQASRKWRRSRTCIVVGVVNDVHEENVDGDAGWQIYYPEYAGGPNGAQSWWCAPACRLHRWHERAVDAARA